VIALIFVAVFGTAFLIQAVGLLYKMLRDKSIPRRQGRAPITSMGNPRLYWALVLYGLLGTALVAFGVAVVIARIFYKVD
jgi:hypothetical protein